MSKEKSVVSVARSEGTVVRYRADAYLTVKVGSDSSGGAFDCAEFVVLEGPPEHAHAVDELFYVVQGTFVFKVGGRISTRGEGSIIYVPGGVPHTFGKSNDGEGRLLVLFSPGGYLGFFDALAKLPPGPPDLAKMAAIAAEFHTDMVGPPLMAS